MFVYVHLLFVGLNWLVFYIVLLQEGQMRSHQDRRCQRDVTEWTAQVRGNDPKSYSQLVYIVGKREMGLSSFFNHTQHILYIYLYTSPFFYLSKKLSFYSHAGDAANPPSSDVVLQDAHRQTHRGVNEVMEESVLSTFVLNLLCFHTVSVFFS